MDFKELMDKYGLKPYIPDSVGDGWVPLIDELITKLIDLGWDKDLAQVKEKFGGLRFYIGNASDQIHDLIREYEDKSFTICGDCGKPGRQADFNGWTLTICSECEKKRRESMATSTQQ